MSRIGLVVVLAVMVLDSTRLTAQERGAAAQQAAALSANFVSPPMVTASGRRRTPS